MSVLKRLKEILMGEKKEEDSEAEKTETTTEPALQGLLMFMNQRSLQVRMLSLKKLKEPPMKPRRLLRTNPLLKMNQKLLRMNQRKRIKVKGVV